MTPDDRTGHRGGAPGLAGSAIALVTREASRVPMVALSVGLQAWEKTRPVRRLVVRRGGEVLQIAAHTPIGRFLPQPAVEHDIAVEAERIASQAREPSTATSPARAAGSRPAPARPAPVPPAPAPAEQSEAAVEAGAPGAATGAVEKVVARLHVDEAASRDELPIPDFDNVSLGSLRARLRSLSVEQLIVLRDWEKDHANRLPVITLLENRIAKLSADPGGPTG